MRNELQYTSTIRVFDQMRIEVAADEEVSAITSI